MDDPNQSANTMNAAYSASMDATITRLEAEKDDITGVVITSAKKTFFAGGDLNDLLAVTKDQAPEFEAWVRTAKAQLRRLETLGVPVAAAINGAALGGGLEIALATHHRVALDSPKVQIGLPEVTLGLLPGGGGVVRTVRLLGIANALMQVLLKGQRHRPAAAKEIGLVDELVPTLDELVPAAKAWVKQAAATGEPIAQPWDVKGYKIPGGSPSTPSFAANLPAFPANLRKQLKGANYPAPHHIMAAAIEGAQVDVDTAFEIEGRYFVDLTTGQVAKNMIQAFFFDLQRVNGDRDYGEPDRERFVAKKAVVLGAGMMGGGIAYALAKAGIEVVLKDLTLEKAENGKGFSRRVTDKAVDRGTSTREAADALLARITPTADYADAAGADLVIEAVFEDPDLKKQVYAEIEPIVAPDAFIASNTSSLPITDLATGTSRPADFGGLHFFSPVDRMPLLEIVKGEQTSDETLAKSFDVARQIKKTPILVKDTRGFFTSRVLGLTINEAIAMLAEGIPAPTIEQAAAQAGFPAPMLQLTDELTLELMRKIRDASAEAAGDSWVDHPAQAVIDKMIDEFGRPGRSSGKGFYEYDEKNKRTKLWPGLIDAFGGTNHDVPFEDLKERLLIVQVLEAVRIQDEGLMDTVADANIGSILGVGFPGWTGGILQYINGYEDPAGGPRRGVAGFVERAKELAERYGDRFEPPVSVVEKAERGETFTDVETAVPA
jgi:3-hydroxyacyl-CoA dehydrogenase / enoyl-CoA hydratase / 3-hydroxybutyryl-CoA epimerase